MRLAVYVLGTEVIALQIGEPIPVDAVGDCITTPIGFVRGDHE